MKTTSRGRLQGIQYAQFKTELRDEEVYINYRMAPAEPSVDIPNAYVDEFHITNLDGEILDTNLGTQEEEEILEKCYQDNREETDEY